MADVKISELSPATFVDSPDFVPIVQAGSTKKATVSLFQAFLKFIGLDFAGNNLTFMNGTTMWKSTGDATHPYTPTTAGMIFKDASNVEFGRIWFSNPDTGSNDNTRSVFIGANAGANTTTHDSVAIGFNALSGGDISFGNTAIGSRALEAINDVNSDQNVAIGFQALQNLTTGYENVAIGYQAGKNLDSGIDNIAIGTNANIGSSTNNSIVIAHGVTTNSDNVIIIGNAQNTDAYFGSTSGNAILHGKGDAIVFPDSDPHIVGAGYWLAGVLTRSAG